MTDSPEVISSLAEHPKAEEEEVVLDLPKPLANVSPELPKPPANVSPKYQAAVAVPVPSPGELSNLVQKQNLLSLCRAIIQELVDGCLAAGRTVETDNEHVTSLTNLLVHIILHRLKATRTFFAVTSTPDPFVVMEKLALHSALVKECTKESAAHVSSRLGQLRFTLRVALMRKQLADLFAALLQFRDTVLRDLSEHDSFLNSDEVGVLVGHLQSLSFLDYSFCPRGEQLDRDMLPLDFSPYLTSRSAHRAKVAQQGDELEPQVSSEELTSLLDQKACLEEINKKQRDQISTLEVKAENLLQQESLTSLITETQRRLYEEQQLRMAVETELTEMSQARAESEVAGGLLQKEMRQRQDQLDQLRRQVEDVKSINSRLNVKTKEVETELARKSDRLISAEAEAEKFKQTLQTLKQQLAAAETEKASSADDLRLLRDKLKSRDVQLSDCEGSLHIEQEWRQQLQTLLEAEKKKVTTLTERLTQLSDAEVKNKSLRLQVTQLERRTGDQERSLAELGIHLSESKLELDTLREQSSVTSEAQWTDDSKITACMTCEKSFSVSRRKHHCRHCGGVVCDDCSQNRMPLPSSAKPVRVCDNCYNILLQKLSSQK